MFMCFMVICLFYAVNAICSWLSADTGIVQDYELTYFVCNFMYFYLFVLFEVLY